MYEFKMPDIGEGLAEAEILEWTVAVGETVREGDTVAVVSTDKANVELSAPCAGIIAEHCADAGDIVAVGNVFMRIDNRGNEESTHGSPASKKNEKEEIAEPESTATGSSNSTHTAAPTAGTSKVRASPAVRRLAAEHGIDLSAITPGPGGMILKEDVERAAAASIEPAEADDVIREKLSGSRLAAAKNLVHSAREMASSSITFDVVANTLADSLASLRKSGQEREENITPVVLIAKCLAQTLRKHRRFNANVEEDGITLALSPTVNMGIAVAAGGDLFVPVVKHMDQMTVDEIATAISELANLARTGKLERSAMLGASFTLSSTGGMETVVTTSTAPVINYPNVATLWASRIDDRPWVADGELTMRKVMSCTLAFDHRFVHGAECIEFINAFNAYLQDPETFALE